MYKILVVKEKNKTVLTPPDALAQAVFETGNKVGALACELFPNGIEIPYENTTFNEKIDLTQNTDINDDITGKIENEPIASLLILLEMIKN